MIRDLPVRLAKYLHPSLRSILVGRQKRWNRGSPQNRLAVNLINRYCRPVKPRVLPFYCDKCHLATRRLDTIIHHPCEDEGGKKNGGSKRYTPYDFNQDQKIAQNGYKLLRKNGLAVMEKTLKPQNIKLPSFSEAFPMIAAPKKYSQNIPTLQELCYNALEFEDPVEYVKIDEIMTIEPSTSSSEDLENLGKSSSKCLNHAPSGTFCFKCQKLFENYSDFQEHLDIEAEKMPQFMSVSTEERTGTINPEFSYRKRRHIAVKRDVSHIRCTSCQIGNFESTDALYAHMVKCGV
ncbi:unnamed protein product [Caenorhabditis angaria]|uniref:Uncharacterized protein n=1 Tax=Caenorhabditis angaria TaxID=860376 RepID=A0A9P1I8Q2_9PELO|nr:unnamed protein product [Caenorhabditis angaria]